MRRRLVVAVLVVACAIAGLIGCRPAPAELPDGVSVIVYQPRTEIQSGRFAIQVTNGSDAPVTVLRAELRSPDYSEPIVWQRHDAKLSPGVAIDLRVEPGTPACTEPSDEPMRVDLDFRLEDGQEGRATLDASDPFAAFPRIPDAECLGILLADVADVEPARIESDGRPGSPGRLVLTVTPKDGSGSATLDAVQSTILVSLLGPDGLPVARTLVGLELSAATGPTELAFPVRPGRCDPHAIAEDKVGTLIPIEVTIGERSGTFRLASTDEFRRQVYAFVQTHCA